MLAFCTVLSFFFVSYLGAPCQIPSTFGTTLSPIAPLFPCPAFSGADHLLILCSCAESALSLAPVALSLLLQPAAASPLSLSAVTACIAFPFPVVLRSAEQIALEGAAVHISLVRVHSFPSPPPCRSLHFRQPPTLPAPSQAPLSCGPSPPPISELTSSSFSFSLSTLSSSVSSLRAPYILFCFLFSSLYIRPCIASTPRQPTFLLSALSHRPASPRRHRPLCIATWHSFGFIRLPQTT